MSCQTSDDLMGHLSNSLASFLILHKRKVEMNLIVVEAIRGRCASFTVLTAMVSEIFGGQTTPSILVV